MVSFSDHISPGTTGISGPIMGRALELVGAGLLHMGDLIVITHHAHEMVLVFLGLRRGPLVGWNFSRDDLVRNDDPITWSMAFLTTDGQLIADWSAEQFVRIVARAEDAEG